MQFSKNTLKIALFDLREKKNILSAKKELLPFVNLNVNSNTTVGNVPQKKHILLLNSFLNKKCFNGKQKNLIKTKKIEKLFSNRIDKIKQKLLTIYEKSGRKKETVFLKKKFYITHKHLCVYRKYKRKSKKLDCFRLEWFVWSKTNIKRFEKNKKETPKKVLDKIYLNSLREWYMYTENIYSKNMGIINIVGDLKKILLLQKSKQKKN